MSEAILDVVKAVPSREEVQEHFRAWLESARDTIPETVGSVEPLAGAIVAVLWRRPYSGRSSGHYHVGGVDLLAGRSMSGALKYDDSQTLDDFDPRLRGEEPATLLSDELPPDRTCEQIARDDGANMDERVGALREWMGQDLEAASRFIAEELCRPGLAGGWRDALVFAAENAHFAALEQQANVCERLRQLALELRESPAAETEHVVWSAMRRFSSLVPAEDAHFLLQFLDRGGSVDTRMVALQCIARVFQSAPPSDPRMVDTLVARVAEYAEKLLDPDVFSGGENSAIARHAVVALAALGSERAEQFMHQVSALGRRWFSRQVRDRLNELLDGWRKNQEVPVSSGALGAAERCLLALD